MKNSIRIMTVGALCAVLAFSCAGNRQKKGSDTGADSPFTVEDLRTGRQNTLRAEGTGKSSSVEMATQIARMNAITVLAGKLAQADTAYYDHEDGRVAQREVVETPVVNAAMVDRRVFRDKKTGAFTVWVLLEASIENK